MVSDHSGSIRSSKHTETLSGGILFTKRRSDENYPLGIHVYEVPLISKMGALSHKSSFIGKMGALSQNNNWAHLGDAKRTLLLFMREATRFEN